VHPELANAAAALAQRLDEVAVQLDGVETADGTQQLEGDGPSPGPISTSRSPGCGPIAATIRRITAGSCRKCWPNRLRGWWVIGASSITR